MFVYLSLIDRLLRDRAATLHRRHVEDLAFMTSLDQLMRLHAESFRRRLNNPNK